MNNLIAGIGLGALAVTWAGGRPRVPKGPKGFRYKKGSGLTQEKLAEKWLELAHEYSVASTPINCLIDIAASAIRSREDAASCHYNWTAQSPKIWEGHYEKFFGVKAMEDLSKLASYTTKDRISRNPCAWIYRSSAAHAADIEKSLMNLQTQPDWHGEKTLAHLPKSRLSHVFSLKDEIDFYNRNRKRVNYYRKHYLSGCTLTYSQKDGLAG
jgi:hypothetical protein